jgi:hypothetical protein
VVADRSLKHGIAGFKRVEDRALRDRAFDLEKDFTVDLCEASKMVR